MIGKYSAAGKTDEVNAEIRYVARVLSTPASINCQRCALTSFRLKISAAA